MTPAQQLAWDTIVREPVPGIGIWLINPMEWRMIDRLAGVAEGTYRQNPVGTYRQMLINSGCCMVDQWIPENPLQIGERGYEGESVRGATTGAEQVVVDGLAIREPEDVVAHLEQIAFPKIRQALAGFDEDACVRSILQQESAVQQQVGPDILKAPYCPAAFPHLGYYTYGYANYFMAYALYPEIMERHFSLQADQALLHNRAVARAFREGHLPPYIRLDHDMAGAGGTLVDIRSLEQIWFPHFARALAPLLKTNVHLIWHCDGNLMEMVPRLLEVGLQGFQGFQYECGMEYEKICRMKTREGEDLLIIAGVSVTTTLPQGRPADVRQEMRWLVENGPRRGLFLGASSSITPGVPWANLQALVEGFWHYRNQGRSV